MWASGASELRQFSHFRILKLLFPSIFCWYFRPLCHRNIHFQVSNYIYIHTVQSMQFPSITYACMVLYIYKQYTDKTLTLRKSVYMRASLEIFRIFTFYNISFNILLVLQIICRYKWHACRLTCTDEFPNVPTKLWKSIIGGGGAVAPLPPSGYAIVPQVVLRETQFRNKI